MKKYLPNISFLDRPTQEQLHGTILYDLCIFKTALILKELDSFKQMGGTNFIEDDAFDPANIQVNFEMMVAQIELPPNPTTMPHRLC